MSKKKSKFETMDGDEVKVYEDEELEEVGPNWKEETVADADPPRPSDKVVRAESEEEASLRSIISDAPAVDEEEWEKVYMGIKEKGTYFDLIHNMNVLKLPKDLEDAQNRKEKRYGWIDKNNMDGKCDSSTIGPYWTPVNKVNHPNLTPHMFNKHGGVYREGMYLCYMPWRMKVARDQLQAELAKAPTESQKDKAEKVNEYGGHYDPTEGGTKSVGGSVDPSFGTIETEDTHPNEVYESTGESVD